MSAAASAAIFESLPGIEVPVGRVAQSLEEIWAGAPDDAAGAPSEFRASQMNLVLHLGVRTTVESAGEQLEIALALSRRHPARTVVLCPIQRDQGGTEMRSKIFSECYIGSSGKEMVCCEVVMLSYPFDTRRFMENQVSVCLETDLPTYYWPHCIASAARLEDYSYLLNGARRIIIDTACETADVTSALAPLGSKVRDLADTRMLQVRQSLGRYMSGFEPASLVDGLEEVNVSHAPRHSAEGRRLLAWVRKSLGDCGRGPGAEVKFAAAAAGNDASLALDFAFSGGERRLHWEADLAAGHARMSAILGSDRVSAEGPVFLLKPEIALAEAIFS
ncbi:MAG TPA: glucose-6-phosphate dehydrogenase assembly protein OpcA [Opitutaceae bacterium]|nr:glucose-6-phosphate dehydrogenase assembly protein OpcA [Opitutaceae bacterium]